jgi:uncharacterized protein with NRDE domain
MWDLIKKKAIEHTTVTIVSGLIAIVVLLSVSAWAMFKIWIYDTNLVIQPAKYLKTVNLPSDEYGRATAGALGVRIDEGMCFIARFAGRYDNTVEYVGVYLRGEDWVYDFGHGAARITARIDCYSHPVLVRR